MKFNSFNLNKDLVANLEKLGYIEATDVQSAAIPRLLKGESLVIKSRTGSGKTHTFLIPIINNIDFNTLNAVIITPTRELAFQTYNFFKEFKEFYPELNIKLFTSGIDANRNSNIENKKINIIIGTPGRMKSVFKDKNFSFKDVKTLVLDEVDMLIENGFFDDIKNINSYFNNIQLITLGATISQKDLDEIRKNFHINDVLNIDFLANPKEINHYFINTKHIPLEECLEIFINSINPYLLFIFASKKEKVNEVYTYLFNKKYPVAKLTSEMSLRERKSILKRIKNDEFKIVVCSDIASRGIDVQDVSDVLNIDIPNNIQYYFHRCGRTARNNKSGNVFTFYDNDSLELIDVLLKLNILPKYLKITNNQLIEEKVTKKRKKVLPENKSLEKEINLIKNKKSAKKVKPNYKKKVKKEIEKAKFFYGKKRKY